MQFVILETLLMLDLALYGVKGLTCQFDVGFAPWELIRLIWVYMHQHIKCHEHKKHNAMHNQVNQ